VAHIVLVFDRPEEPVERALAERVREMYRPDRLTVWSDRRLMEEHWNSLPSQEELSELGRLAQTGPSSFGIPARQALNASVALQAARTGQLGGAPLDWMLHLDHDELFYVDPEGHWNGDLRAHFSAVQATGHRLVRYWNHELLLPHSPGAPLAFKLNPRLAQHRLGARRWAELLEELGMSRSHPRPYFNGYVNGKSAVAVAGATGAAGVHSWRLAEPIAEDDVATLADPAILHLRFALADAFRTKYQQMARVTPPAEGPLFQPPRAESAALALVRSLSAAGAGPETLGTQLEALWAELTWFTESEIRRLRAAGLIVMPRLGHSFPPQPGR
jgi:hypothetical protein